MRDINFTASALSDAAAAEAENWQRREPDVVVWAAEDQPQLWQGLVPGVNVVNVHGEWRSDVSQRDVVVFAFARFTPEARHRVGFPTHRLRPDAAARCLKTAREALGGGMRRQAGDDGRQMLRELYDQLSQAQRDDVELVLSTARYLVHTRGVFHQLSVATAKPFVLKGEWVTENSNGSSMLSIPLPRCSSKAIDLEFKRCSAS